MDIQLLIIGGFVMALICFVVEVLSQNSGNGSIMPDRGEQGNPVGFFIAWMLMGLVVAVLLGII